jgi:LDH2 family malate/lactate/ureidoglycolate dehydrogenase
MTLAVLTAVGTHPDDAAKVADSLIEGNLTGHDSHGVIRLGGYVDAVTEGVVVAGARAAITRRKGATGLVDANRGFGQPAMWAATELAGEIATDLGVSAVAVSQSYHIGRAGPYVESLAKQGLIGLAMANCAPSVAPFGASSRVFGTNPIAWAVPRADRDHPISHDIATAAIAEGKLKVARAKGVEVAPGLIVDRDGNPTVDPNDFYAGGAILTFGEHKGSGLSFLAQLLGRGLAGMDPSTYTGPRGVNGPVLIAIDPECFGEYDEFIERIEAQCAAVLNARPVTGSDAITLPGDPERRARAERLVTGIPIADATVADLERVCAQTGVEMVR